jgi:hypothetical protein
MIFNSQKKILLYLLFGILIYSIIKVLPNNKLSNIDSILISLITVILCICLEQTMKTNLCKHSSNDIEKFNNKSSDEIELEKLLTTIEELNNDKVNSSDKVKTSDKIKSSNKVKSSDKVKQIKKTSDKIKSSDKVKQIKKISDKIKSSDKVKQNKKNGDKVLSNLKSKDAKLSKSIKNEKIIFPFSLDFLKQTLNNVLKSKENDKIASEIQLLSKKSEYYEILIQILQTNIEAAYKFLNSDKFNKINELVIDIKVKRQNSLSQDMTLDNIEVGSKIHSRELSANMRKFLKTMINSDKYYDNNGFVQNMVDNDMRYTVYTPKQQEKLGAYDASFTNGWENDYALLNTDKWRPPISHSMYKCKTEKKCPVCPTLTTGYPVKLKEFNIARKILPPDIINVDYINEKLITGEP